MKKIAVMLVVALVMVSFTLSYARADDTNCVCADCGRKCGTVHASTCSSRQKPQPDPTAEAERRAAWAAYRAEQAEQRARERAAYNKALNEAYAVAESSRKAAELSAGQAQSKARELAQLKNSIVGPAEVDAANRRYQDAARDRKELTNQLDNLQKGIASINVQISPSDAGFGTAVRLNEEDLYKKISPARFVTPSMYEQAKKYRNAQKKELEELQKQSIVLSTLSRVNEERIRVEKQIQSKAIFGLGSDLLDLAAPVSDDAIKKVKVAYEVANSAFSLLYTATAHDYVERMKNANESVINLTNLYNEAALKPTLAKDRRLQAAIQGIAVSLKLVNFTIDQNSKDNKSPVTLPPELCDDCINLVLDVGGVFFSKAVFVGALVSLKERTDQYVHAEDSIKQISKMRDHGANAQEFIKDRILQVHRDLEASERIIKAYTN